MNETLFEFTSGVTQVIEKHHNGYPLVYNLKLGANSWNELFWSKRGRQNPYSISNMLLKYVTDFLI